MASDSVLICPLDWGLGHATRCIPLINRLLKDEKEVIICADGLSGALLMQEFPQLPFEKLKGMDIKYSASLPFFVNIALRSPAFMASIRNENESINQLVKKYNPKMILSDNRYGVYHSEAKSILISHQIFPIVPSILKPLVYHKLNNFFRSFDDIWVPDHETENNLSGELSHQKQLSQKFKFIGPLSRFESACDNHKGFKWKYLGIVSGPEPYRTKLINQLIALFQLSDEPSIIISGSPEKNQIQNIKNIEIHPHLSTKEMKETICSSENIICRSGYSSIMDLEVLKRKAYLIPTPGQTEQEYLAKFQAHNRRHFLFNNDLTKNS